MAGGQGRSPTLPHTLSCVRTRARTTIMCRPSRQDGCTFGGVHGDSTLSAIKTAFASLCLSAEAPPCLGRLPRVGGIFRARLHCPAFVFRWRLTVGASLPACPPAFETRRDGDSRPAGTFAECLLAPRGRFDSRLLGVHAYCLWQYRASARKSGLSPQTTIGGCPGLNWSL